MRSNDVAGVIKHNRDGGKRTQRLNVIDLVGCWGGLAPTFVICRQGGNRFPSCREITQHIVVILR